MIDILDNVSFLVALSAGFASFLSPCVLPLVPAYVTYITGSVVNETDTNITKANALYKSLWFVTGFTLVFIIMAASISFLSGILIPDKSIFRQIGGILIIIFGIHITGIFRIKFLYVERRLLKLKKGSPLLMGIAFAAGWTPCTGPILSAILIYAGSMDTLSKGVFLLIIYSLGLAIPFIITALTIERFIKHLNKYSKYFSVVSIISGIIMIAMGIIIFANKVNFFSQYLNFINYY